jgi:hypothetical protein
MSKQLMDVVLPRLAKTLYRELQRYRNGKLNEDQFSKAFETLLQNQHAWLMTRGISEVRAAMAIHAAVLVLSRPGLRADAVENGIPFEVAEFQAVRDAAADLARNYEVSETRALRRLAKVIAQYGK